MKICNREKLPGGETVSTLVASGGRPTAGLRKRVKLLNPRAVFKELAIQAVTYHANFAAGAPTGKQWKWQPRFIGLPPQEWHAQPYAILIKMNLKRRLRGKQNPKNLQRKMITPHPKWQWRLLPREGGQGEGSRLSDHEGIVTTGRKGPPLHLQRRLMHANRSRSFLSTRRVTRQYIRSAA